MKIGGAVAGLLLLASLSAAGEMDQPALAPYPRGTWLVVVPPITFDRKTGQQAILDDAPISEWTVVPPESTLTERQCQDWIANAQTKSTGSPLDVLTKQHPMLARTFEKAQCVQSDGSSRFTPGSHYVTK